MALTPGVLTIGAVTDQTVQISATKPSTGTSPFTYQFYRSTTSGFSPGGGNVAGAPIVDSAADSVSLVDTGLVPGTLYYYKCIATDDAVTPDTATYTQVSTTTLAASQNPNQFQQTAYPGMIDLRFPYNTVSCIVDVSETGTLYAGQAVKIVDSAGGVPKVVAITADTDQVLGFINFDVKNVSWTAGMPLEISMAGNVIYLYSTAAIARGIQVVPNITTRGGVQAATGLTGKRIVGWSYDKATAAGQLIRVFLQTPSFQVVV